jgi:MFS transporter, DHA2 family, glioxin efflux transporter
MEDFGRDTHSVQTIVATAIPSITDEFRSLDQVGWYGSAFFLTLATFQSNWGKLYKFYSLKIAFLAAGVTFEVGSLICGMHYPATVISRSNAFAGVAQNSVTLIVGRAIAGWGAAGLVGGCYTIIAFIAPPDKRPVYTGLVGTSYGSASVIGEL